MPAIVQPIKLAGSGVMILDRQMSSRRDRGRPESIGGAGAAFVIVALMIAGTTTIAARSAIVRAAPATAMAYASLGMPVNLRGLAIEGVRATIAEPAEGGRELLVTGEIVNLRQAETPVLDLRLALRGEDQRELYVWTARKPKSRLGPHERVAFRARLAAPPSGVRDVLVKLAPPGDKASFTE
jgi:hypothetical protein